MNGFEFLDRWWLEWAGLFPNLPYWNPYVAGLVAFFAIRLAIVLFHIVDKSLWRLPERRQSESHEL